MFEILEEWGVWFISWIAEWVRTTGEGLVLTLFDGLSLVGVPDSYLVTISTYAAEINYFVPLWEIVGMATASFNVISAVWAIKTGLRFIPFIGK